MFDEHGYTMAVEIDHMLKLLLIYVMLIRFILQLTLIRMTLLKRTRHHLQ